MNRNDLPAPNKECEVCGRKYRRCKRCIEMRSRGIEAWREHCDSAECYMTLVLSQTDASKVTREEYERVIGYELPEGRKPVKEIQDKLDKIKSAIEERESKKNTWKSESKPYNSYNSYNYKQEKQNKKNKEKMNVK